MKIIDGKNDLAELTVNSAENRDVEWTIKFKANSLCDDQPQTTSKPISTE